MVVPGGWRFHERGTPVNLVPLKTLQVQGARLPGDPGKGLKGFQLIGFEFLCHAAF